jgi:hypothetical protein
LNDLILEITKRVVSFFSNWTMRLSLTISKFLHQNRESSNGREYKIIMTSAPPDSRNHLTRGFNSTEYTLSVSAKELPAYTFSSKPIFWDLPEQDEDVVIVKEKLVRALLSMEVCRAKRNEMLAFRPRRVCRFAGEVWKEF